MIILVFIFFLCFLSLNSIQAASAGDVLINEIVWMGTQNSANDDKIELDNFSESWLKEIFIKIFSDFLTTSRKSYGW